MPFPTAPFLRLATQYPGIKGLPELLVRESAMESSPAWQWTERHLQAVWYDSDLRPALLRTHTGEAVRVEHPGHWNLEDGPDFLGAALRIGPSHRRVTGDVEVHVQPVDWIRHGHPSDGRYANVVAHVTFLPGALNAGQLRPGIAQIALRDSLASRPDFSFDAIDVGAYPYKTHGLDVPCRAVLATLDIAQIKSLLRIAGEARLHRKAARLAALTAEYGPAQALYEEWMSALGYRVNRRAFRCLARAAPLTVLREESGADPVKAYAFLVGIAGLLPHSLPDEWDAPAHRFFRLAWDAWWKRREHWRERILPPGTWCLKGLRPVNHPLRRLMAAAVTFTAADSPEESMVAPSPGAEKVWIRRRLAGIMADDPTGFWRHHAHCAARSTAGDIRLVGRGRAAAILTNVIVPWMTALGRLGGEHRVLLDLLPREDESGLLRRAAHQFLPEGWPGVAASGVLECQGLIQLFNDFCLPDRSGCRKCRLPVRLKAAQVVS